MKYKMTLIKDLHNGRIKPLFGLYTQLKNTQNIPNQIQDPMDIWWTKDHQIIKVLPVTHSSQCIFFFAYKY